VCGLRGISYPLSLNSIDSGIELCQAKVRVGNGPLDFIARLTALIPKLRVNLTRFHGVFAPNSKHRALVTPAKRGKGKKAKAPDEAQDQTLAERRTAMTWAQRLKRVFNIDIETCGECGGTVKVIPKALAALAG
jgi:hypothetical protein